MRGGVGQDPVQAQSQSPSTTSKGSVLHVQWHTSCAVIEPGEEDCVVPIVAHLLCSGRAQFLRDVDAEMLWDDQALMCLEEEQSCRPA